MSLDFSAWTENLDIDMSDVDPARRTFKTWLQETHKRVLWTLEGDSQEVQCVTYLASRYYLFSRLEAMIWNSTFSIEKYRKVVSMNTWDILKTYPETQQSSW